MSFCESLEFALHRCVLYLSWTYRKRVRESRARLGFLCVCVGDIDGHATPLTLGVLPHGLHRFPGCRKLIVGLRHGVMQDLGRMSARSKRSYIEGSGRGDHPRHDGKPQTWGPGPRLHIVRAGGESHSLVYSLHYNSVTPTLSQQTNDWKVVETKQVGISNRFFLGSFKAFPRSWSRCDVAPVFFCRDVYMIPTGGEIPLHPFKTNCTSYLGLFRVKFGCREWHVYTDTGVALQFASKNGLRRAETYAYTYIHVTHACYTGYMCMPRLHVHSTHQTVWRSYYWTQTRYTHTHTHIIFTRCSIQSRSEVHERSDDGSESENKDDLLGSQKFD
jgi:hypothetical protein